MTRRLLEALGVDYTQWKALVVNAFRLDVRVSSLGSGFQRGGDTGMQSMVALLVLSAFVSVFFGALAWMCQDVFLSGTIFFTYVMFMVGALILIDFHAVVISPDDFGILGYQPVSSRTYLAARLTNVLVYVSAISTILGAFPILAYLFRPRLNPLVAVAAAIALYLCSTSVTLAMILLYAGTMRRVHPLKLRRALSYLQLTISFLIYGGYMFLPGLVDKSGLFAGTLNKTPWILLYPATWFASYLDLARGKWGLAEMIPALLAIAVPCSLLAQAGGKLSLSYSQMLASLSAVSEASRPDSGRRSFASVFFRKDEGRAVALLIRNQFKYDQRFRLAVLSVLPLALMYLYLGLRGGALPDPFHNAGSDFLDAGPLYLILLLFPLILKANLSGSESFAASWIFYAAPADPGRIVKSVKDFLMLYFLFPCLVLLGIVFAYFFRDIWHTLLHLSMLALIAHLFLQVAFLLFPELPFSRPLKRGGRSSSVVLFMVVGSIAAMIVLAVLLRAVYPSPGIFTVVFSALVGANLFFERAIKARLKNTVQRMMYGA
jgi:hypothetical protein